MKNILKLFKNHRRDATRQRSRVASMFKSYGLKPVRDRLNFDYFTILYCQSRYEDISRWYLLYKYLHALITITFLCVNVTHLDFFEKDNLQWHLYLNHWSTLVCLIEAGCGVFVVSYFHHHCRTKAMRNAMVLSDSAYDRLVFYMYLNATAITFSTAASFLFWMFIFDKDYLTVAKTMEHGLMPAFMILKLMVERIPFEIPFVYHPMILLICYFTDVIITYYSVYQYSPPGHLKQYIFKHFNTDRPMYFFWFTLKASLILAGTHVLLVAAYVSKRVLLRLLFQKRRRWRISRGAPISTSVRSYTPTTRWLNWLSTTDLDIIASPISTGTNPFRRVLGIIGHLETLHRQDFIHPEWRHYSADHPSGFYLLYRFFHMLLFIIIIVFSVLEIDKILYEKLSVKYIILWIFYFGNFFLIVSLIQSSFGFVVIYRAYRKDLTLLKYYQKSDSYVTGFQKTYATIHSAATTLAIFAFATSWQLIEDTAGSFKVLDYSYDTSHIINPLAMALDFLVVGHSFKFAYGVLTMGLVVLNFVFNYWLYSSKITSRNGNKFVYEYLNWDNTSIAASHIGLLFFQAIAIHVILWFIFLGKRYYGIALNRRRVLGYQVNTSTARITLSRAIDEKLNDRNQKDSSADVTSYDPEAGSSQNNPDIGSEKGSLNSEGSFTHIGSTSPENGSLQKQIDAIKKDADQAGPKITEANSKSLIEKVRSLSLKLVGSSETVHSLNPLNTRVPVEDDNEKTYTNLALTQPGSTGSSKMSVKKDESSKTGIDIPANERTRGTAQESIHTEESKTETTSVRSRQSRQTLLSLKTALPAIPESSTETRQAANDSAEAQAAPLPSESSRVDATDQNQPSSSKSMSIQEKSSMPEHGKEGGNENPEDQTPIRKPSVYSSKSRLSKFKDTDEPLPTNQTNTDSSKGNDKPSTNEQKQ